jgi:hypothetical protein
MSKSYWISSDKDGFKYRLDCQVGQITLDSSFGNYIYQYVSNPQFKTFLEIGTWNGLGSTKCFVAALLNRLNNDYKFYSLECNKEKSDIAKQIYANISNVFILNEVLLREMPNDIYERFPEILSDSTCKEYNDNDFLNMKDKPLFLERGDIPEIFDVILLDGGDFTTYYEFQLLKNKCRILMLDDTNCSKCKQITEEVKENKEIWDIIVESDERNGYMICKNKINYL